MSRYGAFFLGFTTLALSAGAFAQVCGDPKAKPGTTFTQVRLNGVATEPSFYYRAEDYVVFVSSDVVGRWAETAAQSNDPAARKVAALIQADLPLKAPSDLFRYTLQDWGHWVTVRSIVIVSIEHGEAAVSDLVGNLLPQVTVERARGRHITDTVIYADQKRKTQIFARWTALMTEMHIAGI